MSVSAPTTSTTQSTGNSTLGGSPASSTTSTGAPSESEFLQLMMDQLKNQDPLNPADPTQYMSELASFSSLDEEMQISSSASQTASNGSSTAALNLIGKSVNYLDNDGNPQSGTVSAVDFTSSGPTLTVGTTSGISLSQITGASSSS